LACSHWMRLGSDCLSRARDRGNVLTLFENGGLDVPPSSKSLRCWGVGEIVDLGWSCHVADRAERRSRSSSLTANTCFPAGQRGQEEEQAKGRGIRATNTVGSSHYATTYERTFVVHAGRPRPHHALSRQIVDRPIAPVVPSCPMPVGTIASARGPKRAADVVNSGSAAGRVSCTFTAAQAARPGEPPWGDWAGRRGPSRPAAGTLGGKGGIFRPAPARPPAGQRAAGRGPVRGRRWSHPPPRRTWHSGKALVVFQGGAAASNGRRGKRLRPAAAAAKDKPPILGLLQERGPPPQHEDVGQGLTTHR
jgi:hypothetical protein